MRPVFFDIIAIHHDAENVGVNGFQVLFAQLGTLNGGDTGADNQQNTIRYTAQNGGIGHHRDRRRVHNYIVIGLLQSRKNPLYNRGGEEFCRVRRNRTNGQYRNAVVF